MSTSNQESVDAKIENNLGIQLMNGEVVIINTKPFWVPFMPFYLPSLYLISLVIYFFFNKVDLMQRVPGIFPSQNGIFFYYSILMAVIIIPALAYSFIKLNWRWLINAISTLACAMIIKHLIFKQPLNADVQLNRFLEDFELFFLLIIGLFSFIANESYRRSHAYLVTNARIHTRAGVFRKRERTLILSKVNDIAIDQKPFGIIFHYGSLIPVTASGIGMGSDLAAMEGKVSKKLFGLATVGLSVGGGQSIQIPKYRTHDILFGIRKVEQTREALMSILVKREIRLGRDET